ncbi:hypothetical protein TVAG_013900 [Trichomonas vaginalis G3]|uniref:Uncharacterized protein n=1 Tax=Trichomonas vaginalis (strain ATCC PRA-98 / G3) TaxID=412133 RepID=A2DDE5_TRIV3|nr:hypothetical protein TVAGG3_0986410 [Trichomonas vaginalis G3]EAY21624.1 hypothetical protein TVAG_013900 [Trichomonas vaginalis G3]KAI5489700.1 hypothetical protein TVAGG3_0986410 [Trichomonas vaginalis G3]|eukprot:XP_001582610.1 hypothetical protein [Trichomonas vaginalis G3]
MSSILREFENIHEKCESFLVGLSEKRSTVVKELDSWLSQLFEQIQNQRVLNQQLKNEVPYLYEFFKKAIVLMLRNCSPGAMGVLSIYIIQFVGYNLLNNNPSYVDLLLLLFSNNDFLTKFRSLTPEESQQYNALMSGGSEGYIPHPQDCLFGKKLESGVDFIALTCQNFGRRGYFSVLLSTIMKCQDFVQVESCIQFLYRSYLSMDDQFRYFLGVWFAANLGTQTDDRFNGYNAIHLTRLMFCVSIEDQCLDISATLYSNCLTAAAAANQATLIIEELMEITKQSNRHPLIDKICGQILNLLLQSDISKIADLIIAAALYIQDTDFLDKEFVYEHVKQNMYILEALFNTLQSCININKIYYYGREDIPNNYKFLLKLIPYLDTTQIPNIGDDLVTILFTMPREDVDVFIQICSLNQFKFFFSNSFMIFLDNTKKWDYDMLDLCCRTAEYIDIIDKNKIFRIIARTITGDKIIKILTDHPLIPILDTTAVIKASDNSPLLSNFLRTHMFNEVHNLSQVLPKTASSLSLIFDVFLEENSFLVISHPSQSVKQREIMWQAMFTSFNIGAQEYLKLCIKFFNNFMKVSKEVFSSDVMNLLKSNHSKVMASLLNEMDLSTLEPDFFLEKLKTSPEAIVVLHAIPHKVKYTYDESLIQQLKAAPLHEKAIILDSINNYADETFFPVLKPHVKIAIEVFQATNPTNMAYMYAMRKIALVTFQKVGIDVSRQNLDVIVDFAIGCGYKDLCDLAISLYPKEKPCDPNEFVQTFRGAPKQLSLNAVDLLLNDTFDLQKLQACLRCCTNESMIEIIPKIKEWSDDISLEVYGRFKMIVDAGTCSTRLVELIMDKLPTLPQINADLVQYFFSPEFPPFLRTDIVTKLFINRYKNGVGPLLHQIEIANPLPAINDQKTLLINKSDCYPLNSLLYSLSHYIPFVYIATTSVPITEYSLDLAKLVLSYIPEFESSFSKSITGNMPIVDVYHSILSLLPEKVRQLMSFVLIGDNQNQPQIFDLINVKLTDAYRSFLNTFFNKGNVKQKMGHAPPLLPINLEPPANEHEIKAMSIPTKVDFKEFILNGEQTIYALHSVVGFQKSDRSKYTAFIASSSGGYVQYNEDGAVRISNLPSSIVPHFLFYKRVDFVVTNQYLFSHLTSDTKTDVNSFDRCVTRTVEIDDNLFSEFNRTRAFYILAIAMLRKFNNPSLFRSLKDDKNFAAVFFETGMDIIVKQNAFSLVKNDIRELAQNCPNPEDICRQLLSGVSQPQFAENVLNVIMNLNLSLDAIYAVVRTAKNAKDILINMPEYPIFVDPLFADNEKVKIICNDKELFAPVKKAKLPQYKNYAKKNSN